MHAFARARGQGITRFIGVFLANITVTIIGCGASLTPRTGSGDQTDRDTLPSTIIDDPDGYLDPASVDDETYGQYTILAAPSGSDAATWDFKVAPDGNRPNDELTFVWDFGDGGSFTGPDQTYSFSEAGSYIVIVTAFGRRGTVAFVLTLEIDVPTLNEAPNANAGEDQTVDANSLVFLYGGGSFDPDDDLLEYAWAQTSGEPVLLQDVSEPTASFIAPSVEMDAELGFSLTVSDGELTSQDHVKVYVTALVDAASVGPIAEAGPDQVVSEAATVTLNGTGSSGSSDVPLVYEWYQNAGPTVALSNATGALTTFQAPEVDGSATDLVLELVVTQGDLSSSDEVTISVTPDDSTDGDIVPPPPPPPLPECEVDEDCDDGVGCTDDTCVSGSCASTANDANCPDDGLFCNGTESCDASLDCVSSGSPCQPTESCFEATDVCGECEVDGDCDDGVGCTDDTCVSGSCASTANDSNCPDDGLFCNGTESCDAQLDCVSSGSPCEPTESCFETTDVCGECGVDEDCDDEVGCTDDACVSGSCTSSANDANCPDDGLFCNGTESCDAQLDCVSSGSPCEQTESCFETTDVCGECGVDEDCDDGVGCTDDACVSGSCTFTANDANCLDDGLFCNGTESCDTQLDCVSSGTPCQPTESCFETAGVCGECGVDEDCDDGEFCSGTETCVEGTCVGGTDPCPGQACDEQGNACFTVAQMVEAAYTETAVVLDGAVGALEWSDAHVYGVDAVDLVPPGVVVDGVLATTADTSATLRFKHDADYLFVAVEVQDNAVITTAPQVWEADAVELFFDLDNSDSQDIGLNRFQILANAGGQSAATDLVPPGSWESAVSVSPQGYTVEWRIDKSAVGLSDGRTYGFDVAISDVEPAAGAFATRYWYFSWYAAETDESLWGDLYLQPGAPSPPTLAVSPTSLDFETTSTAKTFEVWNSGDETLTYAVADDAAWLTVSPDSGDSTGERDTLTVTVYRDGLADGQYAGEIVVTPNVGSAVSIAVALTVAQAGGDEPSPVIVASRTSGMAPLAIFFEGTQSKDRDGKSIESAGLSGNDLLEYTWDFGPGSEADVGGRFFTGFNAAHVYETPGHYAVELTVRDARTTAASTAQVDVQPFSGNTYYVRADGNDRNEGTGDSPSEAWQTYERAFTAVTRHNEIRPGDRLLFRRGDAFPYTRTVQLFDVAEVLIGAYPLAGHPSTRPLIQYTGTATHQDPAIDLGRNSRRLAFVDIRVNGHSAAHGGYATGFRVQSFSPGDTRDNLFLRTEFDNIFTNEVYAATAECTFLVGSALTNSHDHKGHLLLALTNRLALLGNTIGKASGTWNIGMYLNGLQHAVIAGNTVSELSVYKDSPCIRIAGNKRAASNIVISDNVFDGADTFRAIEFRASDPDNYWVENVLFERNIVRNGKTLFEIKDGNRDVMVRHNVFETTSTSSLATSVIEIEPEMEWPSIGPIQNLKIHNNTIVSARPRPTIKIDKSFNGSPHSGVEIRNNIIQATSSSPYARIISVDDSASVAALALDFNMYDMPAAGPNPLAVTVGTDSHEVSGWIADGPYSKDEHTLSGDPQFADSSYRLRATSRAIDGGVDLFHGGGNPYDDTTRTPWPGFPGANVYDIGAVEMSPPFPE